MLAATGIAIFLIPALFVMVEKLAPRDEDEGSAGAASAAAPQAEPGRRRTLT